MIIYNLCIDCLLCFDAVPRDEQARAALNELLLRGDLSGVPVDKLVMAARLARESRADLRDFTGKVAAQLNRDGMSWEEIGRKLGMPTMTAYSWAKPFM